MVLLPPNISLVVLAEPINAFKHSVDHTTGNCSLVIDDAQSRSNFIGIIHYSKIEHDPTVRSSKIGLICKMDAVFSSRRSSNLE